MHAAMQLYLLLNSNNPLPGHKRLLLCDTRMHCVMIILMVAEGRFVSSGAAEELAAASILAHRLL
jgi:hypothetical protein